MNAPESLLNFNLEFGYLFPSLSLIDIHYLSNTGFRFTVLDTPDGIYPIYIHIHPTHTTLIEFRIHKSPVCGEVRVRQEGKVTFSKTEPYERGKIEATCAKLFKAATKHILYQK